MLTLSPESGPHICFFLLPWRQDDRWPSCNSHVGPNSNGHWSQLLESAASSEWGALGLPSLSHVSGGLVLAQSTWKRRSDSSLPAHNHIFEKWAKLKNRTPSLHDKKKKDKVRPDLNRWQFHLFRILKWHVQGYFKSLLAKGKFLCLTWFCLLAIRFLNMHYGFIPFYF